MRRRAIYSWEDAKSHKLICSLCGSELTRRAKLGMNDAPVQANGVHSACIQAYCIGRHETYQGKELIYEDNFCDEVMNYAEARFWWDAVQKIKSNNKKVSYAGVTKKDMPDLDKYFKKLNRQFFKGRLPGLQVEWNFRMKNSAGYAKYMRNSACRSSLINISGVIHPHSGIEHMECTLAHEMVHAYLWITEGYKGHGEPFLNFMDESGISAHFNLKTEREKVSHSLRRWDGKGKRAAMTQVKNGDYQRLVT